VKGKEALPNPADMFQSLRYLQDQAARGHFKGRSTALQVLFYLVMNMWVKVPNSENAMLGEVMYGRSGIGTIAASTALSRRSVQYALAWLAEEEWITTQRSHADSGREDRRYIVVRLDAVAHRDREIRRAAGEALERCVREGAPDAQREGAPDAPT
jgi:DNA-binding transcriptional ArsR family regulator